MWYVLYNSACLSLLYLYAEQVEVLSAIVNSIASTMRADAVIDVGAGQVCISIFLLFFPFPIFPFLLSTWIMLNFNWCFNGERSLPQLGIYQQIDAEPEKMHQNWFDCFV